MDSNLSFGAADRAFSVATDHLSRIDHLQGLPRVSRGDPEAIKRASQEFEAYFISYLMKVMRETIPKGFLANRGGDVFNSLYDQQLGKVASEAGGIGLGVWMEHHLLENSAYFDMPNLKFQAEAADKSGEHSGFPAMPTQGGTEPHLSNHGVTHGNIEK